MSELRQAALEYLSLRRSLGFSLEGDGRLLMNFIDHLERDGATQVTTELALSWATRTRAGVNPAHWNRRLAVVRIFAKHLHAIDGLTEIPPADLMPHRYRRVAPHLYTAEQIDALLRQASILPHPLRALTYTTLIALLAVTGLRTGEACQLDNDDVDLAAGVLTIRAGKLNKAREVPLHPTTSQALDTYRRRRDQLRPGPATPAFFVNTAGRRLNAHHVPVTFARLHTAAGIQPVPGGRAPRVHDLRHTFCLTTMLGWYRSNVDVRAQLPLLSTYLGHVDPISTYWYLQAAPELMTLAAQRLDRYLDGAS